MHLICGVTGLTPGRLLITLGDAHVYNNHTQQVSEYLNRTYTTHTPPQLSVTPKDNIDSYTIDDIVLSNYNPQPAIKAPIAV